MLSLPPAIVSAGEGTIGELSIRREDGGWRIEPVAEPGTRPIAPDPDAIRGAVRFDHLGRYRALSGLRGLPGGWFTAPGTDCEAAAVVEAVYPLALVHTAARADGSLRVVGLVEILSRQSGRYENSSELSARGREAATEALCRRCVRIPVWDEQLAGPGDIPCPEPCSVLVALCRESAIWERDLPAAAEPDLSVPVADFESPGNEIREDVLARLRTQA